MEMTEGEVAALRYIELLGSSSTSDSSFPDNSIISSKYSIWNFLPKNLMFQLSNPAKIWFLFISILELSILNENITVNVGTVLPFLLLIAIEAFKGGYSDYLRHASDDLLNSAEYPVWDGTSFRMKKSKAIRVGDIILIYNNEFLPADLIILASGNVEHECYMEASTVLGESSLKIKHAVKESQLIFDSLNVEDASLRIKTLNGDIHVSLPNPGFENFKGKLKLRISPKSTPLNLENLIYRGSKITNTPWIFGVTIYTGLETKAWINISTRTLKKSKLHSIVDKWILCVFPLIALVCIVNTLAYSQMDSNLSYSWSEVLISNIILFGHMIPISLILSFEIIRILLGCTIQKGLKIKINTAEIFSNLGMVEYIVADKTGTITENNLKIVFCVVIDTVYWDHESLPEYKANNEWDTPRKTPTIQASEKMDDFYSLNDLAASFAGEPEDQVVFNYLMCMAVCNLAFPDGADFVAISVDDKELARTASKLGIRLISRDADLCFLSILGREVAFDVLGFQQFSSIIKKSRVVVRNRENGNIFLYVKGSRESMMDLYLEDHYEDEVLEGYRTIYMGFKQMTDAEGKLFYQEYLTAKQSPVNREGRIEIVFEKHEKKLEYLGVVGLEDSVSEDTQKTVKMLKRAGIKFWVLSGDSEESTLSSSLAAGMYLMNDPVLSLCNLTSELDFLNVVQEYIQKGIFECDEEIFNNISISDPMLLEEKVDLIEKDHYETRRSLRKRNSDLKKNISLTNSHSIAVKDYNRSKSRMVSTTRNSTVNPLISKLSVKRKKTHLSQKYQPEKINYVLSIDSTGLEYALSSKQHSKYFISLIFAAKFVCFHSLFPDNKTKVVQILKNNFSFRPLVLSVGDGISDIGMIQAADIGIGIYGKEGSHAANSCDVAIHHFSQLRQLLLVNGHRQYIQLAKMVLISFYAMVLLETELFIYNCFVAFTGSSLIQKEFVVIYRLVLCIIPVSGMCIFDEDSMSIEITPQAFKAGIFNTILTKRNLFYFCLLGLLQGIITFIFTYLAFLGVSSEGFTENSLLLGSTLMLIIICTALISSLLETYSISIKTVILHIGTSMILILIIVPISYTNNEVQDYLPMLGNYQFIWICIIFTIMVNLMASYFFKALRHIFFPGILEIVRKSKPDLSLNHRTRLEHFRKSLKNVFRDSSVLNNNIVHDSEKINKWKMKFTSEYREKLYQADKIMENVQWFKVILFIGGSGALAFAFYNIAFNIGNTGYIIYLLVYSSAIMSFLLLPYLSSLRDHTAYYLLATMLLTQLFFFLSMIIFNLARPLDMYCYIPVLYSIGFSNYWLEITLTSLVSNIFVIITLFLYISGKPAYEQVEIAISYLMIYISICTLSYIASYFIDKSGRYEFNLVQKVQVEIQKTKNVLSYLLPAFVRKRVKEGIRYISENQGVVSIIFCDIYNFEDLLRNYSPQELTTFLDDLFAKFDQKCSLSGCTKIETVGKTYMACAGLKDTENDIDQYYSTVSHARRCVEMGISLINMCDNTYLKNGETLKVKIGINTGPVTAGVVGYHKPQFSLVGDTVNTASRMAALCPDANKIQISNDTYLQMRDLSGLNFSPNIVNAKGKGTMNTYIVSIAVKELKSTTSNFLGDSLTRSKETRKITMYQITSINKENSKRRSSVLENLNEVIIDEAGEFKKNETQQLEEIRCFAFGCNEENKETAFRLESSETNLYVSKAGLKIRILCDLVFLTLSILGSAINNRIEIFTISKLIIELLILLILFYRFDNNYKNLLFS